MKVQTEPGYPGEAYSGITRAQALKVGKQVEIWATVIGVDPTAFTIYPPQFHSRGWTIAAEIGVDDWPFYFGEWVQITPQAKTALAGFLLEPVNHWCLGVYQA